MKYRLPCRLPRIHPNIKAGDTWVSTLNFTLERAEHFITGKQFILGKTEVVRHMTLRNNQRVPFCHGKAVPNRISQVSCGDDARRIDGAKKTAGHILTNSLVVVASMIPNTEAIRILEFATMCNLS
jgi:hypothetical protein